MARVNALNQKTTYTDLLTWPEDGRRYELYDGEVYVAPAPRPRHQISLLELHGSLREYTRYHGGLVLASPIDIVFTEHNVLQPDIAFFVESRRHHVPLDNVIRVPPDVVVEVVSPSTAWNDLGRKKATFARFGVTEYWQLDPHVECLERHSLRGSTYELDLIARPGETLSSVVLPGFNCPVSSLFPW
jgi:Uma2 family endonuclease